MPSTEAGKRHLEEWWPLTDDDPESIERQDASRAIDAIETEAWNAAMDHADRHIIPPAENSAVVEERARLAEAVRHLGWTYAGHTCWDNHEGGVDADGNPTLHADGSACDDRIIGESVSRAAVLALLEEKK